MPWGTFEKPGEIHVAPCSADGWDVGGHVLQGGGCHCNPTVERRPGSVPLVIHNEWRKSAGAKG